MSWESFPSWTPAPLRRHAVLLVEWLQLANALKRSSAASIFLALGAIVLMAAAATILSDRLAATVKLLSDYWLLAAVVTMVIAASSVARRRRTIHEFHLQSWLVAAPIPQASVKASQTIRTLLPIFAVFVVATLSGSLAVASGLAVGAILGWRAGASDADARLPASHYVRSKRTGTRALSTWSISQVRAWSRPENSRYVLIVALFAVQGGSSAVIGLSVVGLYFIGSYLAALLSALLQVGKAASVWLRSTPITLSEFVWLLSRRALIHQALGTALAAAFVWILGAPLMLALQIAALWLSLAISISGCALVDSYRGRSPVMKMAVCIVAWSAALVVLQLRSAERA